MASFFKDPLWASTFIIGTVGILLTAIPSFAIARVMPFLISKDQWVLLGFQTIIEILLAYWLLQGMIYSHKTAAVGLLCISIVQAIGKTKEFLYFRHPALEAVSAGWALMAVTDFIWIIAIGSESSSASIKRFFQRPNRNVLHSSAKDGSNQTDRRTDTTSDFKPAEKPGMRPPKDGFPLDNLTVKSL